METHAVPLQTTDGACVQSAVSLDITEKQHAEQALRESEQRFRMITEAAPIMVWMSGQTNFAITSTKDGWASSDAPSNRNRGMAGRRMCIPMTSIAACKFMSKASMPASRFEIEYRMRHHNGQYRWILDRAVPRYAPDGTFEGYVGGCLDIHDQKEAAEKVHLDD